MFNGANFNCTILYFKTYKICNIMRSLRHIPGSTTRHLPVPQYTLSASFRHRVKRQRPIPHYRCFSSVVSSSGDENSNSDSTTIDKRAYPIALSSLIGGIGMGVLVPILPQLANEVGINAMQYGLVFSLSGLARLLTNIPAGVLSDKFGRKSTLVGGPIIQSIGIFILGQAQSMQSMLTSQYIGGTGGAMQMAGAQAYLSDISTVKNRARTMAPMAIGMSAGMVMGPFIGGILCDYFDSVRVPFYFVGASLGLVALNNWYLLPETMSKEERKKHSLSGNLKGIFDKMWSEWTFLVKDVSNISCIAVHTANMFVQVGAVFILMPLFVTNELGISATQIGTVFAMMSTVNICGASFAAKLSDKFGRKKVIIPAVCIMSLTVPMIPFMSGINALYGLMFIHSIGSTLLSTAPAAYIADIHSGDAEKEERRSQALAMLRSGGDLGFMAGSGSLGLLTHVAGYEFSMCAGSVLLLASGAHFAVNARETVQR